MANEQIELIEETEDEELELDILDSIIDVTSIGAGLITGAGVVYSLDQVIPTARNIGETIMRTVGIGSIGVTTQHVVSNAIAKDGRDIRVLIRALHGMVSHKLIGDDNE
ncbi:MAG: hypothetical protein J6U54_12010 [Clostridiales bacterium]|nr:hypothetical protein [Clostridiales bacterium]